MLDVGVAQAVASGKYLRLLTRAPVRELVRSTMAVPGARAAMSDALRARRTAVVSGALEQLRARVSAALDKVNSATPAARRGAGARARRREWLASALDSLLLVLGDAAEAVAREKPRARL